MTPSDTPSNACSGAPTGSRQETVSARQPVPAAASVRKANRGDAPQTAAGRPLGAAEEELRELLERLADRYNRPEFIDDDPISVPHRFTGRHDREIAGLLAATIAWGNRPTIVRNGHRMMHLMDDAPADFVRNASERELAGLGAFFEARYAATGDLPTVLAEFRREFFAAEHAPRCEKHLSSIERGAACKRLCMYLRWMVRRDARGVDFGLWSTIPMSALRIPLDVHVGETARALGLLTRRQNDWRAVEETTAALRRFDAADPVRFDFALFGIGVDAKRSLHDLLR